jgi:hypothetical protein
MGLLPERRDISQRPVQETAWLEWSVRELNYEVAAFRHSLYDTVAPPPAGTPASPRHDYSPELRPAP